MRPHGTYDAALIGDIARRHRGLALALLIAAATLLARQARQRIDYWQAELPNFDSYVYVTMAENPAFFTVAPWGYRLLHPWIVGTMPARFTIRGFEYLTLVSLTLTGGLLFLFLRRLGHGELPSLLGVLAFAWSGPVAESVQVPFLGEPVAVMVQMALVVALEAGAGLPVLAFLLAAGAYAKESAFFFIPLIFLSRRAREGDARAARAALLCALPAVAVALALRFHWTPWVHVPSPAFDRVLVRAALDVLRETWRPTAAALLLGGTLPLALLGALRRKARPYLVRYGYLAVALVLVSLAAWVNVPAREPVPLFSVNTRRILIYALPFLIPLALVALDRVWPHMREPAAPPPPRRLPSLLAGTATAALVLVPFVLLDRYRRAPLHESRDGPLVRVTCQETLRTARRLSRGETVSFDPAVQKFAWGVFDPAEASRMRWFLRKGWGAMAHYGTGDIVMHEAQAGLLVPCLVPRPLEATLILQATATSRLQAFVNGIPAGSVTAGRTPVENVIRLEAHQLFRGDNLLTLAAGRDESGVRLRRFTLRPPP